MDTRLFLGPGFRPATHWNRLVETVKTRKKREKTEKKWARYGLKGVREQVHSVGSNLGRATICALLLCYKDAAAVDLQPGGNKRSLAELPIARGGHVCPLFPAGYVERLEHDDGLEARL